MKAIETIIIVGLLMIVAIIIAFFICGIIYLISKGRVFSKIYHDIFEWHVPNTEPIKFDGCNIHTHCKICGKEVMQDSQGNWF